MFESAIVNIRKPDTVKWSTPKFIELNKENDDKNLYSINKGAEKFLYNAIHMKPNTSKEVYKLSEEIWNELMTLQLKKAQDSETDSFSLEDSNLVYLIDGVGNLVDVLKVYSEDQLKDFENKLNKYIMDITTDVQARKFFTDGSDGTLKLICYNKDCEITEQEYTPVVILELNTIKSTYNVYTGILLYKSFSIVPNYNPYYTDNRISTFITNFDLKSALETSMVNSKDLYTMYTTLLENDLEVSAREMLSILKTVGYKLTLQDDNRIGEISNLTDEVANAQIQNFFNSFVLVTSETATEILSLSDLQKIFRYNKITFLDLLKILSKEYLTYEGSKITAEILSQLLISVFERKTDKSQSELIKRNFSSK